MPARRVLLVLLSVLVSSIPLGSLAGGAESTRSARTGVHRVARPSSSLRAWTAARMAAARPMPVPALTRADLAAARPSSGDPYLVEGSRATQTEGEVQASAAAALIPFTRTEIEDPTLAPYVSHGRVFFQLGLMRAACSGTAIASDNRSVVLTAGHCLYDDGAFATNVIFVPGYEEGTAPFGSWAADVIAIPPQYEARESARFDFGVFSTQANAAGVLGDVVGMRGIAFNQHPTEAFQSFGYPARPNPPFDGEHLQTCVSTGSGRLGDGMIAMGCDMEEGSSGGGWVMRGDYVASVQSRGNMNIWPGIGFGPYLGDAALAAYNEVRGGTSPIPQPTPVITPSTPVTHKMSVTLRLRKHLVATGRLVPRDGFSQCAGLAPVGIYRQRGDTFFPVGKLHFTDAEGRFRARLRDRRGTYAVFAEASPYDLLNRCGDALDFARHRH